MSNTNQIRAAIVKAIPTITPSELMVCVLMLQGKSTKEMAADLNLSERTVQNHRYRVRQKFGKKQNLLTVLIEITG